MAGNAAAGAIMIKLATFSVIVKFEWYRKSVFILKKVLSVM